MRIVKSNKSLITYVFGFGRSDLILSNKLYANEFFYGYHDFVNEYKDINYIEFEANIKKRILSKLLFFLSKVLRKVTKLSFFFENICTYKNFKKLYHTKNIILTNDRIGLSALPLLMIYKIFKINKSSVIVMGLLAKDTNNFLSHVIQRIFLNLFFLTVDNFIFLSKSECNQAKVSYKKFKEKFIFIPFSIDTGFWQRDNEIVNEKSEKIIFIGNDGRREYDLVLEIAKSLPEYEFSLITSNIKRNEIKSKNVTLYEGQWNKQLLSDGELRDLYLEAKLSIIPIKNSYQPSGQSVALQSMSMGIPVMITDTVGFWDKDLFKNNENIFFVSKNNLNTWIEEIRRVLNDKELINYVSNKSKNITSEIYNSENFYKSMKNVIIN